MLSPQRPKRRDADMEVNIPPAESSAAIRLSSGGGAFCDVVVSAIVAESSAAVSPASPPPHAARRIRKAKRYLMDGILIRLPPSGKLWGCFRDLFLHLAQNHGVI